MEINFDGSMSVDEFMITYNGKFSYGDKFTCELEVVKQLPLSDVYNLTAFLEYNLLLPIPTAKSIEINNATNILKGLIGEIGAFDLRLS